jgi:Transglycosylase SLT domain
LIKRIGWGQVGQINSVGHFARGLEYNLINWNDGTVGYSATNYLTVVKEEETATQKVKIESQTNHIAERVIVPNGTSINIRDNQGLDSHVISNQKSGSLGTVVKTGQTISGYLWKYIKWDIPAYNGVNEGWSVDYLLEEPSYTKVGDYKTKWMQEAGIAKTDYQYVDFIVNHESGWNPKALNPISGACGLAQALPCSKTGCQNSRDPICSLKWQNQYVKSRYGNYKSCVEFWKQNNWY